MKSPDLPSRMALELRRQVSSLCASLDMAEQDATRVFKELRRKVKTAGRLADRPPDPRTVSEILDIINDCDTMVREMHGMRLLGDTAWEHDGVEGVPDGESLFV